MLATDKDWARGYAKQALSDLDAREKLVRANAEKCHRLHFLQMAAEKVCKAHLITANGHENVRNIHTYVARNLPILARFFYPLVHNNNQIARWQINKIKRLAREIELLAPACSESDMRRDNSEYPWEDARGNVLTPCDYNFPNINDGDTEIVTLIKLIRKASESYV